MDKMSVWSILFVSFPEELLILSIALAAAGYKDLLNFKEKKNIFKLITTSLVMLIFTVFGRSILSSITLNLIIQALFIYVLIVLVFKCNLISCMLGLLLSLSVYIASESIFVSAITKIFSLSLQEIYNSDLLRILVSTPERIVQIITIIAICRVRKISFQIRSLSYKESVPIILYCLIIISCMVSIEAGVRNLFNDTKTIMNLVINICITVIFSSWMIFNIIKLKKKIFFKENIHDVELYHLKQLLEEGKTDYAIELLDLTLKDRGYYKSEGGNVL